MRRRERQIIKRPDDERPFSIKDPRDKGIIIALGIVIIIVIAIIILLIASF